MGAIERALIQAVMFLEIADDDTVDPDDAVAIMESIGAELQDSTSAEKKRLRQALKELIAEEEEDDSPRDNVLQFYESFFESFGIED